MEPRYEKDAHANDTNRDRGVRKKNIKILYPELSYRITGICFQVHKQLGRFCREKQYAEVLETTLRESGVVFKREEPLPIEGVASGFTNRVDFVINNTLLLEVKAKPFITKLDYYQMQRYLQASGHDLGLIVNFRNAYLKPIRIIRIES